MGGSGFGECGEAADEGIPIYWVPTVYRAVHLGDLVDMGVESSVLHRASRPGLREGIPVALSGGTSLSRAEA